MDGKQLNHGRWQFVGLDAVALDLVAEQICQLEEARPVHARGTQTWSWDSAFDFRLICTLFPLIRGNSLVGYTAAQLKRAGKVKERIEELERELTGLLGIPEPMTVGRVVRRHRRRESTLGEDEEQTLIGDLHVAPQSREPLVLRRLALQHWAFFVFILTFALPC